MESVTKSVGHVSITCSGHLLWRNEEWEEELCFPQPVWSGVQLLSHSQNSPSDWRLSSKRGKKEGDWDASQMRWCCNNIFTSGTNAISRIPITQYAMVWHTEIHLFIPLSYEFLSNDFLSESNNVQSMFFFTEHPIHLFLSPLILVFEEGCYADSQKNTSVK